MVTVVHHRREEARVAGLAVSPLAAAALLGTAPREGLLIHPETMNVVSLDSTGWRFWQALRDGCSVAEAVDELATIWDVDADRVAVDVHNFIVELDSQGLVTWCTPPSMLSATDSGERTRVTAIIASHNRRDVTVTCLRLLFACVPSHCALQAVLVDDGSTDGTAAAVAELGLPVTTVQGPGDWYWSRTMAEAEMVAEQTNPDVVLWLNDDVQLDPTALGRALAAHREHPEAILVGALWSPTRGDVSFTGLCHADVEAGGALRRVAPGVDLQPVEQFHGNFVMVPRSVRRRVGPIDGSWPHHYADLDYAERARSRGVATYLLPGLVGSCEPQVTAWLDPEVPWLDRVRALAGRKGWPPVAHIRFHCRHRAARRWRDAWAMYVEALTGDSVRRSPRSRLVTLRRPDSTGEVGPSWVPVQAADLIRLGPPRDGGYVVSRTAVTGATHLVSGGLGDDWAFEAAFRALNPVKVTVYDGTVGWTSWLARTWQATGRALRQPDMKNVRDIGRYFGYRRFFSQSGVRHTRKNLTATGVSAVSMLAAIDAVPDGDIFVKLDIEGGEFGLLGSLVARRERITGLVMEVHMVGARAQEISDFIDRLDTHALTFVRANNAGGVDDQGLPRLLEMTWTRRDLLVQGTPEMAPLTYSNVEDHADVAFTAVVDQSD